ncbi:MAG: phage tail tape measure protein [Candidatus Caldarchaeum sp.]
MPVSEFTLRAVFEAEDRLSKSINQVKGELQRLGAETEKQGSRMSGVLSDVGKVAAGVLGGLFGYELIGRVRAFVEESIKNFAEFERASLKLAALSREAGQDVGKLAAVFRTVAGAAAREFAVSGNEALAALEALVKAGLSGGDAMRALGGAITMAKIEGVDFATAGNNLVQVMAQFGVRGEEAARVVDTLVNASRLGIGTANDFAQGLANVGATARGLGLSLEDATSWLVVLERRFGSAHEAGTALNRFLLDLYDIANKLGVPIRDASGSLRDANAIILYVVRAVREAGVDFATLQERLKGVDMRALKALFTLSQMTESFSELRDEVGRSGSAMEAFDAVLNTTAGRFEQMQAQVDRAQRRIGEAFSGMVTTIGSYVLPAFQYAFDAWSGIIAWAVGDAKSQLESAIDSQLLLGRVTQEQAAQWIMSWVEMGRITEEEALDIASRTLDLSTIMSSEIAEIIEKHTMMGREVPEALRGVAEQYRRTEEQAAKTGDTIVDIAKRFGLAGDKALELAGKILGLNITYDEHSDLIRRLMSEYGLSEEQARGFIQALEAEGEAAKAAAEAEKQHQKAVEDARNTLQSSVQALLDYGAVYGPLKVNIDRAREALETLGVAGSRLPSQLSGFLDFVERLNQQFAALERSSKAVAAAQQVAATGASYYSTIVSIQEGLIADQVIQLERQIEELRRQEEALRQSGDAAEQQIQVIRQQRAELERQLEGLRESTRLTAEQAASQERLAGIQSMLALTSQVVGLQQTALQLAMMGADETANTFMNTSIALATALEDGIITQEEYKNILQSLGVTFDEQGRPVINLKNLMDEFKNKLAETQNQVESFRNALQTLDGMTVHTYHYHHQVTVPEGGVAEEEWRARSGLPMAQAGMWRVPADMPVYLHRGEMVLPRPVAEWLRRGGWFRMNATTMNVAVNVNVSGVSDPDRLAEVVSREIARRLRAM